LIITNLFGILKHFLYFSERNKKPIMRKADLINQISEKTGIPKVDVLVTLETMFKEVKQSLANGENIYIRGFGSFITKKRAAKIGRNIKKNIAVEIPEHFIPAFKPAKEFMQEIKSSKNIKESTEIDDESED
jgi:DNA-binding protein HU-beta